MSTIHSVGAGGYGAILLQEAFNLSQSGGCTLGGVVVDPKVVPEPLYSEQVKKVQAQGWKVFLTLDELISGGSSPGDVLLLPLPIHLHSRFVIQGLEAGFNVVCEKPVAGSLAEGRTMSLAASQARGKLYFGYQHVLGPGLKEVRRLLQSKELGDLVSIRARVLWPRTFEYYDRNSWAGRLEVGGFRVLDSPIQNATAHFVHALLLTAGDQGFEPTRVKANHLRAYPPIDSADTQTLNIDLENTEGRIVPALFAVSHAVEELVQPEVLWECTRGTICWTNSDEVIVSPQGKEMITYPSTLEGYLVFSFPMRAAVKGEDPDQIGIGYRDSIRHTRVIDAAFQGVSPENPVPRVSDRWIRTIPGEPDSTKDQLVIRGIREVIEHCFVTGLSLQEAALALEDTGIGWAGEVLVVESSVAEA